MSSFPQHEKNIRKLEKLRIDVSEAIENGEVTMESWGYDDLVYLMSDVIPEIEERGQQITQLKAQVARLRDYVSRRYNRSRCDALKAEGKALLNETPAQSLREIKVQAVEEFKDELVKSVSVMLKPHIEGVCAVVTENLRGNP